MYKFKFFMAILIICICQNSVQSQAQFETGDKIEPAIEIEIASLNDTVIYSYCVFNASSAEQDIWRFGIIINQNLKLSAQGTPFGWRKSSGKRGENLLISWSSIEDADVKPGSKLCGISVQMSSSLLGLISFYAEGYAPAPSFEEGMAPDSLPGYEDLTPFGPGVVGTTVGPVPIPETVSNIAWVDTLTSYTQQSFNLGWINDQKLVDKLDKKLQKVKDKLATGEREEAISVLKDFIEKVEEEAGMVNDDNDDDGDEDNEEDDDENETKITSEAYALLKFNAEYLKTKLCEGLQDGECGEDDDEGEDDNDD